MLYPPAEAYSKPNGVSKTDISAIIVNGFKLYLQTIITNSFVSEHYQSITNVTVFTRVFGMHCNFVNFHIRLKKCRSKIFSFYKTKCARPIGIGWTIGADLLVSS